MKRGNEKREERNGESETGKRETEKGK